MGQCGIERSVTDGKSLPGAMTRINVIHLMGIFYNIRYITPFYYFVLLWEGNSISLQSVGTCNAKLFISLFIYLFIYLFISYFFPGYVSCENVC